MSYEEEQKTIGEIIQQLPQRVKVADSDDVFREGDVIVLELTSSIEVVQGTNRVTGEEIRIPYYYQKDVYQLGKRLSSVEEIKKEQFTWFSVEKSFETPVSPWKTRTVPSGSVVELTDIEHDGGIVVRHGDDPVFIPETTPLYFNAVLDEKSNSLKKNIEHHGLPLDIVIKDDERSDDSLTASRFPPGNYRLTDVNTEEFIFGYSENVLMRNAKQQFIIAASSNILLRQEISSPQTRQPYKNAFFVPKHLYDNRRKSDLFIQHIYGGSIIFQNDQESVPELPPRRTQSPVHRASLKANGCTAPTRPERRRRQGSQVFDDVPPSADSRLPSFGENQNENLSTQSGKENQFVYVSTNTEDTSHFPSVTRTPAQYMALNPETEATSVHIYDEMRFEETEEQAGNVPNQSISKPGVFQRCCGCVIQSVSVNEMSVSKLVALLNEHGLSHMANICCRNKLDGAFVSDLTIEQLSNEPYNLTDEQVEILMNLIANTD